MNARNLGFMSSWHMLTRDKGWIKPVLVLTLVAWIPFLGQIVLLGYGMEWARLTAWGIDAAPKQRGVDYGKLFSSGGRAFLVTLSLGIVVAFILEALIPGTLGLLMSNLVGTGLLGAVSTLTTVLPISIAGIAVGVLAGTFLQAAALRATIYDSFSAGWRIDRLFQMIGRDFGGFLKTFLVMVIGGAIQFSYSALISMIGFVFMVGGLASATALASISGGFAQDWDFIADHLLHIGAGPLLLFLLMLIAFWFVGGVIATAMGLVSMNAMGQWFCRFEVARWGTSKEPLPAGVPHRGNGDWAGGVPPVSPVATGHAPADPLADAPTEAVRPMPPTAPAPPAPPAEDAAPVEPSSPTGEAAVTSMNAAADMSGDTPTSVVADGPGSTHPGASCAGDAPTSVVADGPVSASALDTPFEEQVTSSPISADDQDGEGPIQA